LSQGTNVLAVHLGFMETDLNARMDVDRLTPQDVVAAVHDARISPGAREAVPSGRREAAASP
jgi:hypothetical protein